MHISPDKQRLTFEGISRVLLELTAKYAEGVSIQPQKPHEHAASQAVVLQVGIDTVKIISDLRKVVLCLSNSMLYGFFLLFQVL